MPSGLVFTRLPDPVVLIATKRPFPKVTPEKLKPVLVLENYRSVQSNPFILVIDL